MVNDIDAEFSNIEAIIGYAKKIDLEFRKNEIDNRLVFKCQK